MLGFRSRYDHIEINELKKYFAKKDKFSDCRKSIPKQIWPSCKKIFQPHFVFVWFHLRNKIWRFKQNFGVRSKCFGKELPSLSMFICNLKNKLCRTRKGVGKSFALQCYSGLVSSSFLCKVASFRSFFFYSLPAHQDCVLPVLTLLVLLLVRATTTTTTILYLTTLHLGAKKRSLKHVRAKTMYTVSVTCPAGAYTAFVT